MWRGRANRFGWRSASTGSVVVPIAPNGVAGLAAWFKSDVGITIATGVSQWDDQSGNARHLVQATGSLQPSFVSSAVGGKPAVTFDGTDDFMAVAFALVQPSAVFLVMRPNVLVAGDAYCDGGAAPASMAIEHAQLTPNRIRCTAGTVLSGASAMAVSTWGLTTAYFNGASSLLQTSDNVDTTGNAGVTGGGGFTLGARQDGSLAAGVSIAEAFIFSAIPSASDRSGLRSYVRDRYFF